MKSKDLLIRFYFWVEQVKRQILITVFGYQSVCKHRPTCSTFTLMAIKRDGTISGLIKGLKRVLTCW